MELEELEVSKGAKEEIIYKVKTEGLEIYL